MKKRLIIFFIIILIIAIIVIKNNNKADVDYTISEIEVYNYMKYKDGEDFRNNR